jgi:hypothetical protein
MKASLSLLLCIVSLGWLVPAYLSVSSYYDFQRNEVQAYVWNGHAGPDSFPHLAFSRSSFEVAFAWFAIVAVGWGFYFIRRAVCSSTKGPNA